MFMPILPQPGLGGILTVDLTYSSDASDIDLEVAAGSPGVPMILNVTIDASADIYSTSRLTPAMDGSNLTAGTIVNLIVNGRICGERGLGGGQFATGQAGGTALKLGCETHITGSGSINGGGGGGGGGQRRQGYDNGSYQYGYANGGAGGHGQNYANSNTGGSGGGYFAGTYGGSGGSGGTFGNNGSSGNSGSGTTYANAGPAGGGAGGKSIDVQGQTYTNSVTLNGSAS